MSDVEQRMAAVEQELRGLRTLLERVLVSSSETGADEGYKKQARVRGQGPTKMRGVRLPPDLDARVMAIKTKGKHRDVAAALIAIIEAGVTALDGPPSGE